MIFTTGDTVSPDTHAFIAATGNPFLSKPFTMGELRTKILELQEVKIASPRDLKLEDEPPPGLHLFQLSRRKITGRRR